jgi:hypothetical protein
MHSQRNWNSKKSTNKNNSKLNNSFQYNPNERLMSILKRISESDPILMTKLTFLKERKKDPTYSKSKIKTNLILMRYQII